MAKIKDLTGQRFGMLEVLERDYSYKKRAAWICRCDCGKIVSKIGIYLTAGETKSCGSHQAKDIINEKFGRLTVIKRVEDDKHQNARWLCKCDCGNFTEALGISLRNGRTKSCGCLLKEVKRRRKKDKRYIDCPLYWRFSRIKDRCYNINNPRYKDYGGRGIKICDEWLDKEKGFINFYNWAISNGYKEGLTIDRINVNGDYEPNNCRWATMIQQNNNKRNNIIVKYNNENMTLKQWSDLLNLNYKMVYFNYKRGIKLEKIPQTIKDNQINKAIIMYDKKTNEIIKRFKCVNEAMYELNLSKSQRTSIYACLNGKQQIAYGYKWRYADADS